MSSTTFGTASSTSMLPAPHSTLAATSSPSTSRRKDGPPVKESARRRGFSKSSVSLWVRDIELTAEQHATLRAMNPAYNRQLNGWLRVAERHRARRLAAQQSGRELARRAEPLHLGGCMLYWGEGAKGPPHQGCFSNSDPEMVRLFRSEERRVGKEGRS